MRMVELAAHRAREMGYQPLLPLPAEIHGGQSPKNVGYCKPGHGFDFNVDIMEEIMPIAAAGAGAIPNGSYPAARRIERAPNVKKHPSNISPAWMKWRSASAPPLETERGNK